MNPSFLIQGKLNQLDNGDNQRADGDADWDLRPEDLKTVNQATSSIDIVFVLNCN